MERWAAHYGQYRTQAGPTTQSQVGDRAIHRMDFLLGRPFDNARLNAEWPFQTADFDPVPHLARIELESRLVLDPAQALGADHETATGEIYGVKASHGRLALKKKVV